MLVTINGCSHPDSLSLLDPKLSATEKADSTFKFICRKVKKYGSLDKNPRPVWIESDGTRIPAHTFSINGVTISVDVANGESPLLSLRRIAWKYSIAELLWIYQAASNDLVIFDQLIGKDTWEEDQKINNWWEEWAIRDKNGDYVLNEQGHPIIGACYGETVRRHNLMRKLLNNMEKDPDSRRHIISLWQDSDFDDRHGLKPCVHKSQFVVRHEKDADYLDASVDIRSWDYGTAGAINQNQYLVFLCMVARHLGYTPGVITYNIANLQLYDRHIEIIEEMLRRSSIPMSPKVTFNTTETDFFKIPFNAIKIEGYDGKKIDQVNSPFKFPVAV